MTSFFKERLISAFILTEWSVEDSHQKRTVLKSKTTEMQQKNGKRRMEILYPRKQFIWSFLSGNQEYAAAVRSHINGWKEIRACCTVTVLCKYIIKDKHGVMPQETPKWGGQRKQERIIILKGRKFHTGRNINEKYSLLRLVDSSTHKYWSVTV